jgi:hypothetical protein
MEPETHVIDPLHSQIALFIRKSKPILVKASTNEAIKAVALLFKGIADSILNPESTEQKEPKVDVKPLTQEELPLPNASKKVRVTKELVAAVRADYALTVSRGEDWSHKNKTTMYRVSSSTLSRIVRNCGPYKKF